MNLKKIEQIILRLKNGIKDTEFENNIYICGGYLRDLYYSHDPDDLDLILISNTDKNIFLNFICNIFNIKIIDFKKIYFDTFRFEINKVRIDLKILNNLENIENFEFLRLKIINEYDFTINGLIKNISTEQILQVSENVINDLRDKKINLFNDLNSIFLKSPVRIFRLMRFYYMYDLKIPLSILRYIKNNSYLINFIDKDRLIDEYNKIFNNEKNLKISRLLNILNINPTNLNRFPVFFGEGWYELEPSQEFNKIIEGKKYRWSKINPEIFIGNNIELLKLTVIKHPSIKNKNFKYYYDNDINTLQESILKDGHNEILFNVSNHKKINIIVDTFIPSEVENTNDDRKLGLCLTDCKVYQTFINKDILIEYIPYHLVK